jgi:hypothetical protein
MGPLANARAAEHVEALGHHRVALHEVEVGAGRAERHRVPGHLGGRGRERRSQRGLVRDGEDERKTLLHLRLAVVQDREADGALLVEPRRVLHARDEQRADHRVRLGAHGLRLLGHAGGAGDLRQRVEELVPARDGEPTDHVLVDGRPRGGQLGRTGLRERVERR